MKEAENNDQTIWECISSHKTKFPDPLILSKGEKVKLGDFATEENWENWIWAENASGKGGWIPVQIINISTDNKEGIVKEAYSAKELNINKGEKIIKIYSLNGWAWAKNVDTKEEGWIPNEIIKWTE